MTLNPTSTPPLVVGRIELGGPANTTPEGQRLIDLRSITPEEEQIAIATLQGVFGKTAFFEDEGEVLTPRDNLQTEHETPSYTYHREPVFPDVATPNATRAEPSLNSPNPVMQQSPIEGLYWSIRTSLRNALFRTGYCKGVDTAEIFAKYHTNGKDTEKLTDELRHLLSSLIVEAQKEYLETNRELYAEISTLRSERDQARNEYRHLLQKVQQLGSLAGQGEKDMQITPHKPVHELIREFYRRDEARDARKSIARRV